MLFPWTRYIFLYVLNFLVYVAFSRVQRLEGIKVYSPATCNSNSRYIVNVVYKELLSQQVDPCTSMSLATQNAGYHGLMHDVDSDYENMILEEIKKCQTPVTQNTVDRNKDYENNAHRKLRNEERSDWRTKPITFKDIEDDNITMEDLMDR